MVSVPVLSELMALVAPSVSTSVRFLTTALCSASCRDPLESIACTKVGRPVGMAEIAIEMPSRSTEAISWPRTRSNTTITATAPHAIHPSTPVRESSSRCSGDFAGATAESIEAMRPISVPIPVSVTTIVAVPRVTWVFWNTMFTRSPSVVSGSRTAVASLAMGALSPVSAASWVSRVAARSNLPSAGTMSPASRVTTSPGTSVVASTSRTDPSRSTFAWGTCIFARASTEALAFISCRVPSTTFSTTRAATMIPTLR